MQTQDRKKQFWKFWSAVPELVVVEGVILFTILLVCVALMCRTCSEKPVEETQPITTTEAQPTETTGPDLSAHPRELVELLERNPETEEFVLGYFENRDRRDPINMSDFDRTQGVPLMMQWDSRWGYRWYGDGMMGLTGCGPTCLSMVGWYLTGDPGMDPVSVAEFAEAEGYYAEGSGSSWTLISEGAEKLGMQATEIPLDENQVMSALEAGNPIICAMGPGDFTTEGHYIVLTGVQDGQIRVNDPNSRKNSGKLWSYAQLEGQIFNLWILSYAG